MEKIITLAYLTKIKKEIAALDYSAPSSEAEEKKESHLPEQIGTVDGFKIVVVDGNQVKLQHNMDFVEGNNFAESPEYIPHGQVWIDADMDEDDWQAVCLHEVTETRLMQHGWIYDDAHEVANMQEKQFRLEQGA